MDVKFFILLVIGIWIGLLLGLSFIEAPLKFTAPGISMELGVGIGRIMFTVLNKIELFFSFAILACLWLHGFKALNFITLLSLIIIALVVALQSIWLLPALDQRASLLLAGNPQPGHLLHLFYVVGEILKLILLFISFFNFYKNV